MIPSKADWENELCAAYRAEIDLYSRALALAEQMPAMFPAADRTSEAAQEIVRYLDEVARVEARISKTKSRWNISGAKPGPDLRAMLAQTAELIRRLDEQVKKAEQAAVAQRDLLAPALDNGAQAMRMRQAYGGVMALGGRENG
jgi:hypothetical protein